LRKPVTRSCQTTLARTC